MACIHLNNYVSHMWNNMVLIVTLKILTEFFPEMKLFIDWKYGILFDIKNLTPGHFLAWGGF